jgi:hypothetical protein
VSAPELMLAGELVGWFGNKTCVVSSISFLCVVTAAERWRVKCQDQQVFLFTPCNRA